MIVIQMCTPSLCLVMANVVYHRIVMLYEVKVLRFASCRRYVIFIYVIVLFHQLTIQNVSLSSPFLYHLEIFLVEKACSSFAQVQEATFEFLYCT